MTLELGRSDRSRAERSPESVRDDAAADGSERTNHGRCIVEAPGVEPLRRVPTETREDADSPTKPTDIVGTSRSRSIPRRPVWFRTSVQSRGTGGHKSRRNESSARPHPRDLRDRPVRSGESFARGSSRHAVRPGSPSAVWWSKGCWFDSGVASTHRRTSRRRSIMDLHWPRPWPRRRGCACCRPSSFTG